jgi:hypothetical protein
VNRFPVIPGSNPNPKLDKELAGVFGQDSRGKYILIRKLNFQHAFQKRRRDSDFRLFLLPVEKG